MSQPNILLILCDQMRLSCLATYGETPCQTPNLDRLAAQSVIFDNAYTPCPLCTPARASVITGLMPHQHGMTANSNNTACAVHNLLDRPELLSRKMQGAGYDCIYTGKWHLGLPGPELFRDAASPSLPSQVGFRGQDFPGHGGGGYRYPEYRQWLAARGGGSYQVEQTRTLGKGFVPHFGIIDLPGEHTVPAFLVEHSMARIDEALTADRPFFCWHNFWGPHEPYFVPQAYHDRYRDIGIPEWPNYRWDSIGSEGPHRAHINPSHPQLTWQHWAEAIRHYYAFMTLIDEQIGRLIDHLDARGVLDETLVVFSADHGESLGSHGGLLDKGVFHFEEIQRIPMLMRLPGAERAGERRDELVSLVDLHPTCCESAGVGIPEKLAGMSLHRLLAGDVWRDDLVVQSEGVENCNITLRSLRHDRWKYCFSLGIGEALYDLAADPHEMTDLSGDPAHRRVLDDMRTRLVRSMRASGDRVHRNGLIPMIQLRGWQEPAASA